MTNNPDNTDRDMELEAQLGSRTRRATRAIAKRMVKSDSLIFTFLRSVVSSQTASWVDLGIGFMLFAWLNFQPWLSTAIGAVAGGIINCIINYRFTFHAQGVSWRAVIVKYALVWVGSILLNSLGTQGLYMLIEDWHWLERIGFKPDGYYAAARLFVSLMVSWFWNFVLQRYFVYRPSRFDATAERFMERLNIGHHQAD